MNTQLLFFFFFFNDTATTEIYTLSLHDALPISDVIHFESIGELNSVSGSQKITSNPVITNIFDINVCPSTTPTAMMFLGLLGLALLIIVFGLKSNVGGAVFLGGLMIFIMSWSVYGCQALLGDIMVLISMMIMVWSFTKVDGVV